MEFYTLKSKKNITILKYKNLNSKLIPKKKLVNNKICKTHKL